MSRLGRTGGRARFPLNEPVVFASQKSNTARNPLSRTLAEPYDTRYAGV